MKKSNTLKYLSLITLSLFIFTGCKQSNEGKDNEPTVLFEAKENSIVLGTSADYPPFEFKKQGEFAGIDIEIARTIASKLGYELKIQDLDFSSLVGALKSGRVDFIMSSVTATIERMKSIDFSDVYYQAEIAALHKKGVIMNKAEDFSGKKVGVQLGTIMEAYIKKVSNTHPGVIIEKLNKNPELVQNLKVGRIDVVLLEEAQAVEFSKNNDELTYDTIANTGEGYAIGFKKGSPLKDQFNEVLRGLVKDGTIEKIKQKWINPSNKAQ